MGGNESRKGSADELKEWLARHGAPWRPFEDAGTLVSPQRTPRTQAQVFSACEKTLLAHLKSVCLWPERQRDVTWHLGDFAYYVLDFSPVPGTDVYVQFWSEPDEDGVIFEVSSGAWNPPADKYVDPDKQELLRDHGFELGGKASNFEKVIAVSTAKDIRALAREAVTILCKVLGYDGTKKLTYGLHLGTRLAPGMTHDTICASDLSKMMRRWGYVAQVEEQDGKPRLIHSFVGEQPFMVGFMGERPEGTNQYGMIGLRTYFRFEGGVPEGLLNAINTNFAFVKASVDAEGDLAVETTRLLHGGVTAENLELGFDIWKETIEEIVKRVT